MRIEATVYVARAGQKAILIGEGGSRIRDIGARARGELAALLDAQVHLFLNVRERAGWDEEGRAAAGDRAGGSGLGRSRGVAPDPTKGFAPGTHQGPLAPGPLDGNCRLLHAIGPRAGNSRMNVSDTNAPIHDPAAAKHTYAQLLV